MKVFKFLAAIALTGLCLMSCSKDNGGSSSTSAFYQTYWEGSVQFSYGSTTEKMTCTYFLQMYFKTESESICQYTLTTAAGPTTDYYTTTYKLKDSKTAICTPYMSTYEETATLSPDGNTLTYHTKIVVDDENSWTDIIMTKKPVPSE